jgi:HlyD family secretion protein
MHPQLSRSSMLAVLGLIAVTGAACTKHSEAATSATSPVGAPEVTTVAPKRQNLIVTVEQPGRVEAFEQTPVFAKIAGYVKDVRVEVGSRVKKGDVLAELDVPEMVEELTQKQGMVTQASLEIRQSESAVRVAAASVVTADSLAHEAEAGKKKAEANQQRWKSESARMDALVTGKVIDPQSRDETQNQLKSADAALEEAAAKVQSAAAARAESVAKRDKAEADLASARNHQLLAESDVRRMQAMLDYARITAPFDGVVADRRVHTGHFLQPASGGTKGEALFVVVRIDKVRVFVDVPEQDAVLIRDKAVGRVRVQVLNDREFTGEVAGASWSLEPGQRTMRTEIDLPNPDGLIRPGMYVHAIIAAERTGAWTLPSAAIIVRDGQTFCFREEAGKAVRTAIKIGGRDGATVEVMKKQRRAEKPGEKARWEDLVGDERVIVTRPGELTDGQAVRVTGG